MKKALIAIVDDEDELLANFKTLLSDQYDIETFNSPQLFLDQLPDLIARNFKLVVSDYKMPGMNGLEMIKQGFTQKYFPFIILSGQLEKQTVIAAVEIGVFRLLEKPCNFDDLTNAIDQLLLEGDLTEVRKEIRLITSQLRELYSTLRLALLQYIPEEAIERMVIDAPGGKVAQKMTFDSLLEKLEHRLERLLMSEKMLNDLKSNQWRAS